MKKSYLQKVNNSFLFRLFLIAKLPIAWIAGTRVLYVKEDECAVGIRYKYLNQNPFKSMYFACQAMAAEMSTGLLAMGYVDASSYKISMLVLSMKAEYSKKAVGKISFECRDGNKVKSAILQAEKEDLGVQCEMTSIGYNQKGEEVSKFKVVWTFKRKN